MYECIVYANTIGLRNEIEFFFIRSTWKVSEIPDPADPDPQRYAILSVIPHLLVRAFNRLIEKGLPRDAPAIVMGDDHFDELASRPKILETVPAWCVSVPEIDQTLVIPSEDGSIPVRETASDEFKKKNVIVFEPHILFVCSSSHLYSCFIVCWNA